MRIPFPLFFNLVGMKGAFKKAPPPRNNNQLAFLLRLIKIEPAIFHIFVTRQHDLRVGRHVLLHQGDDFVLRHRVSCVRLSDPKTLAREEIISGGFDCVRSIGIVPFAGVNGTASLVE